MSSKRKGATSDIKFWRFGSGCEDVLGFLGIFVAGFRGRVCSKTVCDTLRLRGSKAPETPWGNLSRWFYLGQCPDLYTPPTWYEGGPFSAD